MAAQAEKRVITVLETGGGSPQDRVRGPMFEGEFRKHGIEPVCIGRHDPNRALYSMSKKLPLRAASALAGRVGLWEAWDRVYQSRNEEKILNLSPDANSIYLIKTKSDSIDLIRNLRVRSRAKIVYDFADALWLPNAKASYGGLEKILESVDAVTTDNSYSMNYVKRFNENVFHAPPPSQVEHFDKYRGLPRGSEKDGVVTIGWVGSPSTLFHLFSIWEALELVFKRNRNVRLRILGSGFRKDLLPPFEYVTHSTKPFYTADEMYQEILGMDIALFPAFDVEDTLGRGTSKATIYMGGATPVLASRCLRSDGLLQDGVNGMLAGTTEEWTEKLEQLVLDPNLRKTLGEEGLQTVRRDYTLEKCFSALKKALSL